MCVCVRVRLCAIANEFDLFNKNRCITIKYHILIFLSIHQCPTVTSKTLPIPFAKCAISHYICLAHACIDALSVVRTRTHTRANAGIHACELEWYTQTVEIMNGTIWASRKIFVWMDECSLNGWRDRFSFRHRRRHRRANLIEQKFNSIPPSPHIPNEITPTKCGCYLLLLLAAVLASSRTMCV